MGWTEVFDTAILPLGGSGSCRAAVPQQPRVWSCPPNLDRGRSRPSHAQPARTSTRRGGSFGARGSRSVSTPCFSSA